MINEENFAERLSQLRESKQVSAREMSLAIGQNCSYINRIENKKAFPSMQCFFYICDYLQITPQEFFDDDSQSPHTLNELMESLKTLSPKQLNLINNIVIEFQKKQTSAMQILLFCLLGQNPNTTKIPFFRRFNTTEEGDFM